MKEGNVNVDTRWIMPNKGVIKCNVHGFFSEEPMENGNHSGIGVIFRNSKGMILRMVDGSLSIEDRLNNEYHDLVEGMKEAHYKDYTYIVLDTDHQDAYWNWYDSSVLGRPPEHEFVMQQLNQRKAENNFRTEIRLVDPEDNMLAAYLARHDAETWKQMVVIREIFGRVREIWMEDMGLGWAEDRFRVVYEEELNPRRLEEEVVNPINEAANPMNDNKEDGLGAQDDEMMDENNM